MLISDHSTYIIAASNTIAQCAISRLSAELIGVLGNGNRSIV